MDIDVDILILIGSFINYLIFELKKCFFVISNHLTFTVVKF